MTQNMSTEPPQVLLHMLCSRITGLKGESLTPHYKIAMAALSSSISNPVENDEFKIAERIKKKLNDTLLYIVNTYNDESFEVDTSIHQVVKRGSAKDCAIFSELHQKMKARSILKNRSAVLALLYCLSGDTSESSKTFQSNAFNLGLTQCMTSTPFVTGRQKNANAGDTMTSGSTMLRSTSGEMTTAAALRSASSAGSSGISSITASSASGRGDVTKVMVVPPSSLPLRSGMMTTSLPSHVTPNVTNKGYIPKPGFSTVRTSSAVEVANRNDAVTADNTSFEIPETRLLRDVLYICQGIEGTYIKYDTNREGFKVDAKAGITWSVRQHLLRLAECGWLHNKVRRYADSRSTDRAFGLVGQSFCTALHQELTEYYKLIAVLEAQLDSADGCSALTLRRVAVWTCEPRVRLRMLAALVDICHAQKGGALASAIHSYIQHGDPAVRALVQHTLALVSQPIYSTIMTWIYDGQLEDTYHEFFVASDPTVKDDRLWHDKYSLRKSMIPSFLTMDQANKDRSGILDAYRMINKNLATLVEQGRETNRSLTDIASSMAQLVAIQAQRATCTPIDMYENETS